MNIIKFLEILSTKAKYLIILPVLAGVITFLIVKKTPPQFSSYTTIFTGTTSNSGLDVNGLRIDKSIALNEYNNMLLLFKSNSFFEEISLRLLAQHLSLSKPQKEIISKEAFDQLQNEIPANIKKLVVKADEEKTYENLRKNIKQDENNFLYKLLIYDHPYYSINDLSKVKVEQINSSDLFKLSYQCDDPGICFNVVKITARVFIENYGDIKRSMKTSAVRYFQTKLDEVSKNLNTAEDSLLTFNTTNEIINLDEQTKQVTTQHQEIEIKLQDVKMDFQAATIYLKKVNDELSERYSINIRNVEIMNIRNQLVQCNNQISGYEILHESTGNLTINDLKQRKNILENRLKNNIDSLYKFNYQSQGIEPQKLLGEWVDAVKKYETTKSNFASMQSRLSEFMLQYKRYAPLGSSMKRIERKISVYENEYLNVLNNLNTALQNGKNSDLLSKMRLIDEPQFPIVALPSKKKLNILLSAIITLLLYILGLFFIELMDHRIKTPENIVKLTGIEFIGAYCLANLKKYPNPDSLERKATTYITEKIKLILVKKTPPFVIQILSIWDGSGKSIVAEKIANEIGGAWTTNKKINLMEACSDTSGNEDFVTILQKFYKAKNYQELLEDEKVDCLICVVPSISRGIENPVLIQQADVTLMTYNANFAWSHADEFHTTKIKQLVTSNLYSILTNAIPTDLEEVYGEIEKKRSTVRKLIKKGIRRITKAS